MVVEGIADGLLTNMFSEIYKHGEYTVALPAATAYFQRQTRLGVREREKAVTYVAAHVEDDVEAAHFLVVVEALERFLAASGTDLEPGRAEAIFRTYLRKIGEVMQRLGGMMRAELEGRTEHSAAGGEA
jgi:hypothetical protein